MTKVTAPGVRRVNGFFVRHGKEVLGVGGLPLSEMLLL